MRHAILVLGMHCSGTSAFAGALTHLGVSPPLTLMPPSPENERGYFESLPFVEFHDTILAAGGSRWNDWRRFPFPYGTAIEAGYRSRAIALLDEEFADAPLFVMKDPRACRLVPFCLRTLRHANIAPHVIIPIRSPLEVAQSLAIRSLKMPPAEGVILWLRHVLDAERDSQDTARSFLFMDDLLADWRGALGRIGRDLPLTWPVDLAAAPLESFLSRSMQHQEASPDATLIGWASDALARFSTLVSDPCSRSARATLDEGGASFDQAFELFDAPDHPLEPAWRGALYGPASNDNGAGADLVAAPRLQARFWALEAQTTELRTRFDALRDQTLATAA